MLISPSSLGCGKDQINIFVIDMDRIEQWLLPNCCKMFVK